MSRSFDRLARPYRLLESLAFGKQLEAVRSQGLAHAAAARRALLIGDGDGRFAAALLRTNPSVRVHSVDISRRMLETARRRIRRHGAGAAARFLPIQGDARLIGLPVDAYDFVSVNFVLDCLTTREADVLLRELERTLVDGGLLAYGDFQVPESPRLWRAVGGTIIRLLYLFFAATAGIESRALPQITWPGRLSLRCSFHRAKGLLVGQVRQKTPPHDSRGACKGASTVRTTHHKDLT